MITPFYERDGTTIYCGDCLEILPLFSEDSFDAVITDPPYGMKWNTDSTRFSGGNHTSGDGRNDWPVIVGDDKPFDPLPWLSYPKVILWGSNHFSNHLPRGTTLVWIKKADHLFGTFLSDAEIGWMKGGYGVYCFRKQFPSPSRMKEGNGSVLHPTQKPIALMKWCFEKTKINRDEIILDPYMGSGTTLVAAQQEGYRAIGIEISEQYCDIAVQRLKQPPLFYVG